MAGDFVERSEMQAAVKDLKTDIQGALVALSGDVREMRREHRESITAAVTPLTAAIERQNGRVSRLERLAAWGVGAGAVAVWLIEHFGR